MNTDELERLMREAMPAPWRLNEDGTISLASGAKAPWRQTDRANCALIVAAVNALPELLAERDRLRQALEELSVDDFHSSTVRKIALAALNPETGQ